MHTEDLIVDYGRNSEVVEQVGAVPPHIQRPVLLHALVVEAVHLRDYTGLVVAT